jgi:putative heme iron utilization protein
MPKPRSFTGIEARQLLRRARTGMLATLDHGRGTPYASLANVATDVDGRPVILISQLAWHTRNLVVDERASLLVAELPEQGEALTGARVTIMGRFVQLNEARLRRRYLARHPESELYVDLGDFALWRLEPETVHAVAGFGRIETLEVEEVFPSASEMIAMESAAIADMNEHHKNSVQFCATQLLGGAEGDWKISAIDPDGVDLNAARQYLRLHIPDPVYTAEEMRTRLLEFLQQRGARDWNRART